MKTPSLSEQMDDHVEGRERLEFGRQVEREAIESERNNVDAYLQKRIKYLNSRGQVGDTFRVDELLARQRDIRAAIHTQAEPKRSTDSAETGNAK